MSPPGITPEWSSSDYFDDDGDLNWPIRNVGDLRSVVRKCLATAARSQAGPAAHFEALNRAAVRLEQTATNSQYLIDATVHLRNAAAVVEQAHAMLQSAHDNSNAYLDSL